MNPVQIHSGAEDDLNVAMEYYEARSPGLGDEFRDEVEQAIEFVRSFPQIGSPTKNPKFRMQLVRRFPFVVYYTEKTDAIWIMAVAHGKRRGDYWSKRKPE